MLTPVRLSGDRFTTRSLAPARWHQPNCPCWEGAHTRCEDVAGNFTAEGVFSQRPPPTSEDKDWNDLAPHWRTAGDFRKFAAWAFSEAMLRAYLRANPELPSLQAGRGVDWAAFKAELHKVLSAPFFSFETSFYDLLDDLKMGFRCGVLPVDFLEKWDYPALAVKPLFCAEAAVDVSDVLLYDRTTKRFAGRCHNIGGIIDGPYFFFAVGKAHRSSFAAHWLYVMPLIRDENIFLGVAESRFERYCLLSNLPRAAKGFKPLLLSHLLDFYAACGMPNAERLDVRVDLAIPDRSQITAVEFLGLKEADYLRDALAKIRIAAVSQGRVAMKFVMQRKGRLVTVTEDDIRAILQEATLREMF